VKCRRRIGDVTPDPPSPLCVAITDRHPCPAARPARWRCSARAGG
jgi:hypothetical protein